MLFNRLAVCRVAEGAMVVTSTPTDVVNLRLLMELAAGRPEVAIGLIDGPLMLGHPDLVPRHIRYVGEASQGTAIGGNAALAHGTHVAGILAARRGSGAPSICPGCTLLTRPVLQVTGDVPGMPSATPDELAEAITDCVNAGAWILNLSVAVAYPSPNRHERLERALDHAADRSVIVVAAAGNQGTLGSSPITLHPWVVPVVACDSRGRPLATSNLGSSIGRRGLMAPGDHIRSLGPPGYPLTSSGTSVAAPFVTGAAALLWSLFPEANGTDVKHAITSRRRRQTTVVPPLLDAGQANKLLSNT